MFKYSHPIIPINQKWRITKMVYMDEWEYNLWLQLHKDELLATKHIGSEDSKEQKSEDSKSPERE